MGGRGRIQRSDIFHPVYCCARVDTFYDVIVCTGQRRHSNNRWWGWNEKAKEFGPRKHIHSVREGGGDRESEPRGRLTRHYQEEGNELEEKTNKEERETRGDGDQEGGSRESRRNRVASFFLFFSFGLFTLLWVRTCSVVSKLFKVSAIREMGGAFRI